MKTLIPPHITHKLLLFLLIFIFCHKLSSQNLAAGLQHLTIKDGLSNNHVLSFLQDHNGFMWIGTHDGLNKYDGYKFSVYKKSETDTNSISDNIVRALAEDKKGNIWIGTNNGGLIRFNPKNERFKNFIFNPTSPNSNVMNSSINNITIDSEGNIWMIIGVDGLLKFNPINNKFTLYTNIPNDSTSLGDNFLACLHINSKKELMVGSETGLSIYNSEHDNFENIYFTYNGVGSIRINSIIQINSDKDEIYWLASSVGIIEYNRTSGKYNIHRTTESGSNEFMFNNFLNAVESSNNNLWIGSYNGIYIFNTKSKSFYPNNYALNIHQELKNNSIITSFKDAAGILWLSCDRNGILKFDRTIRKFGLYKHSPFDKNSIPDKTIHSIYKNSDSTYWIGTIQEGLLLLDKNKKVIKSYKFQQNNPHSLAGNNVNIAKEDSRGNLWVGHAALGLNLAKNAKKERSRIKNFQHYLTSASAPTAISHETVMAIFEDSKGRLWIGTEGGLDRFDYETEQFSHYYHNPNDNNSLTHNSIQNAIAEDDEGNLWVGTWEGLTKMDVKDLDNIRFTQYKNNPSSKNSLQENRIISIHIDENKNIWLGTFGGGLIYLNAREASKKTPQEAIFINYTEAHGLSNNTIYVILGDDLGNLWLSTNNGLSKFNIKNKIFTNYHESSGLQSDAFYWGSGFKSRSGKLYFGGPKGFNSFLPEKIKKNEYSPPVVITDFSINFEKVPISNNSVLKEPITNLNNLRLSYKHKIITFEFASLHYSSPIEHQYKYKLEGFDNKWINVGSDKRFATYTNLDPGKYTFKVKATNSEGFWSKNEVSLNVYIEPPFWEKIWFKIIIIVLVLSMLIAFYYYRTNNIKKRNIILANLVHQRTNELKEKNDLLIAQTKNLAEANSLLEERQQQITEQKEEIVLQRDQLFKSNAVKDKLFSIISHDLKGPIGAIKSLFEMLKKRFYAMDNDKKLNFITLSNESISSIYELLTNLLDWSRFQQGNISFKPEKTNLNEILQNNINLAKGQTEAKQITLETNFQFDSLEVNVDKTLFNTIIRNLLNNAIKYSNIGDKIELSYKLQNNEVIVSVKDNGLGLDEATAQKIFDDKQYHSTPGTKNEKGTGLGLNICKEFIKLHNGKIWVNSKPGEGATFYVSFPG